jgi:hypothetical protein
MHFESFSLGARHLFQKLVFFFSYMRLIVIFQNKNRSELLKKKYVFVFEKKYFDSLALKPRGIREFHRPFCSLFTNLGFQ